MGVEKRVKTTSKPKKPPANINYSLKPEVVVGVKVDDNWSDDDADQLTEPIDDSRVELTAVLIISLWALLQPVASGNRKLDNKF